jgi:uncharacterized damage-inducible protein DinB
VDFAHVYDVLTQARHKLFDWLRPLSQDQYTQKFSFGLGTPRATMVEIARAEWLYGRRIQSPSTPLPPRDQWPITEERLPTFRDLETVWAEQAPRTRALLAGIKDWDAMVEYKMTLPTTPPGKVVVVTALRSDLFMQMAMHEVHHRAQVMAMLRQLGIAAQNLDYTAFATKRREEPA